MSTTSLDLALCFDSIVAKVQRAEKHVRDYYVVVRQFIDTNPYGLAGKRDPQSGKMIVEATEFTCVPPPALAIAGDAIHNLRSALDYLARTLVLIDHGTVTRDTGFPILDQQPVTTKQQAAFDTKVEGMRQETKGKIAALKPYARGNDVLWRLHRLDIIDKHHLLFAGGAAMSKINPQVGPVVPDANGFPDIERALNNRLIPVPGAFPLQKGCKFAVDPATLEKYQGVYLLVEVALNEPDVAEGIPLIVVLQQSMREVRQIVWDLLALRC